MLLTCFNSKIPYKIFEFYSDLGLGLVQIWSLCLDSGSGSTPLNYPSLYSGSSSINRKIHLQTRAQDHSKLKYPV